MTAKAFRSKKAKGKLLEKLVAQRLKEVLAEYGIDAKVMPMSGAISGFKSDIFTNLPVNIECKNQERVSLWEWWEQAENQTSIGRFPTLVISRNYQKEPLAVLRFEDLLTLFEWSLQAGWVSSIRKGRRIIK